MRSVVSRSTAVANRHVDLLQSQTKYSSRGHGARCELVATNTRPPVRWTKTRAGITNRTATVPPPTGAVSMLADSFAAGHTRRDPNAGADIPTGSAASAGAPAAGWIMMIDTTPATASTAHVSARVRTRSATSPRSDGAALR